MNHRPITTDQQLAWWLTRCRNKWRETSCYWTIQVNTSHWSALWVSDRLLESLRTDGRQISRRYHCRYHGPGSLMPAQLHIRQT